MNTEPHQPHGLSRMAELIMIFIAIVSATTLMASVGPFHENHPLTVEAEPLLAEPQPPLLLMADPVSIISPIEAPAAAAQTVASLSAALQMGTSAPRTPFNEIIVAVAARYGVDPHLIRAIIFAESGYNPRAKSEKGAKGLMQLMPATAEELGVQNIYNPEENIDGGVRYFKYLLDRFDGDVQLALAAYNAGYRHVRNYEGVPPFKATEHYVEKVLKFKEKFKRETHRAAPVPLTGFEAG
jgi:soluble lytic murein transglycosylase-like protein